PPSLCNRRALEKPRQVGERVDAVEEVGMAALAVEQKAPQTGAAGTAVVLDERVSDVEDLGGGQIEARAGAQEDVRLRLSGSLDGRNGDLAKAPGQPEGMEQGRKVRVPVGDDRQ